MIPFGTPGRCFRRRTGADYLKLTLANVGTPARLLELIRQAREIGFKIILGNGQPGTIGCWLEGQVQILAGLINPGEMTGFRCLKDNWLASLFEATATGLPRRTKDYLAGTHRVCSKHCLKEWIVPSVVPDFIRHDRPCRLKTGTSSPFFHFYP